MSKVDVNKIGVVDIDNGLREIYAIGILDYEMSKNLYDICICD